MNTCSTCQFFKADESVCRRYPPMAMMYPTRKPPVLVEGGLKDGGVGVQLGSTFAPTTPDEWCGEWRISDAAVEAQCQTSAKAAQARQLSTHRTET